jgi:hypothetical protein
LRSQRARGWTGGSGGLYQSLRTVGANRETEFVGLDAQETKRAVDAGRRVLKLAGIEPRGFVAPGYAYTPALRQTLSERFHWWTALWGLHRAHPGRSQDTVGDEQPASTQIDSHAGQRPPGGAGRPNMSSERLGPPIALSSAGRLRRALSPALLRAGALASGTTLRLDLHPSDLDHPSHMLALEWVLKRSASSREAVTYDELAESTLTGGAAARPSGSPSMASSAARARWAGRP